MRQGERDPRTAHWTCSDMRRRRSGTSRRICNKREDKGRVINKISETTSPKISSYSQQPTPPDFHSYFLNIEKDRESRGSSVPETSETFGLVWFILNVGLFYILFSCILYREEETGCHLILFCVKEGKKRWVGEEKSQQEKQEPPTPPPPPPSYIGSYMYIRGNIFFHSEHRRKTRKGIFSRKSLQGLPPVVHILSFYGSLDTRSGTKWAPQFNYFILRRNWGMMGMGWGLSRQTGDNDTDSQSPNKWDSKTEKFHHLSTTTTTTVNNGE